MFFDVMTRTVKDGKQSYNVFRCHENELSKKLREAQDSGSYVFSVIPLRRRYDNGGRNNIDKNKV